MKLIISIVLSFLLALFAYIKKSLTNKALLVAFTFSVIITYFGGLPYFLMLLTVFLGTVIASKIKKEERLKVNKVIEKSGKKDVYQILANVLVGTVFIIIYEFTKNVIFLVSYASVMAEALSDSLASDIGVLSKKDPINILTLKKSVPGLSGNISLLGLASSFIGSLLIALIFLLFNNNFLYFLIITFSGFIGALIDSILGATIQVKYECINCSIETEKEYHCNKECKKIKGFKYINNDAVNFLSNLVSGIIAIIILII